MKIVICTKKDLAGCLALNRLLEGLINKHEIRIILSDFVMKEETNNHFGAYFVSYERNNILEHIFPYLDSLFPNGAPGCNKTFTGLQKYYDLPMELWDGMRSPEAYEKMKKMAPDIIISCRYDYIFPDTILGVPRLGTYGLHPGKLPCFQGLCGPFRAMELGESHSCCTLFHVDPGIDTGPVIDFGWQQIAYEKSVLWNFVHTYRAGIDTFLRHLHLLEMGDKLQSKPQQASMRRYFPYPTDEEFHSFIQKGGDLVLMEDYLKMLSWFLPNGIQDTHMPELERLVTSLGKASQKALDQASQKQKSCTNRSNAKGMPVSYNNNTGQKRRYGLPLPSSPFA